MRFELLRLHLRAERTFEELIARFAITGGGAVEVVFDAEGALTGRGARAAAALLAGLRERAGCRLEQVERFVPRQLLESYRRTTYAAALDGGTARVRVGERAPALDAFAPWAFVTAENPGSRALPAELNSRRTRALHADLRAAGLRFLPGRSEADDGAWPAEESVLVAHLDEPAAVALARRHGQNALVAARAGAPARLVLCVPGEG